MARTRAQEPAVENALESAEPLFDEMKRYVGFGPADEQLLAGLLDRVRPRIVAIVDDFYAHILDHPGARAAITGGHPQVERLKGTLCKWVESLFVGPWDQAYYELRARIGRKHVEIALPQQYMVTAVNVIRSQLAGVVLASSAGAEQREAELQAINKLLDMELGIMLHTYREDYLRQMQRSERLATFGQLVASIGHELRNPLGVMESSLFLLRGRVGQDERVVRHLDKIQGQIHLSNRIVSDLLEMVRDRPPTRRAAGVRELLESAVENTLLPPDLRLSLAVADGVGTVLVDPDQVRQILVNLLQNAGDAAGPGGEVRLSARAEAAEVVLLVNDSGPGIDPAVKGRLFEPLVTTKVRGIGLGLALCRRLAERNSGSIGLAAGPLPGAGFELRLPAGTRAGEGSR